MKSLPLLFGLLLVSVAAPAETPDSVAVERLRADIQQLQHRRPTPRLAWAWKELGDRYDHRFGFNKYSLDAYFEALHTFRQLGDSTQYYDMHTLIGNYYTHDTFMRADARRYFERALAYYRRGHNVIGQLQCRLGIVTTRVGPRTPAPVVAELHACEALSRQHQQPYYQANALNLLANVYLQQQRWDSARHYARASLTVAARQRIDWLMRINLFYLGLERQYQQQPDAAITYFRRALAQPYEQPNLTEQKDIGRHLADAYAAVGNFSEAFRSARRVIDYTEAFHNSEQTKNIRLQELNLRVRNLEVEKQLVEQQRRHQSLINSLLIVGLVLAGLAVLVLIVLRRQQLLIGRQKDVINQQHIRQLELRSLRALIEGQEKERCRIARDLHDGLGAQLSRIKLFAEAHAARLDASVRRPLNQFIDDACQETRLISNNLRPYTLSAFGLLTALADLVNKLNLVNDTVVVFEHYGELPTLDEDGSVMLYRVVQELLSNALKHAEADRIVLQFMVNDESVLISVEDDGRGYCEEAARQGSGMENVRSRIDYLGGQVIWHSERDRGTSVLISVPLLTLRSSRCEAATDLLTV